jgi:D-glycero-D-manno-heptose 1,7-bisphosphate phosphatase
VRRLSRKAAFLDRDGTLNVKAHEHEYVASADDFVWLPGAVEGLARLARAGYVLVVVSNQRGVGRGLVTVEALRAIEDRIQRDLAAHGSAIEAFRYCFHQDEDACDCRKPKPGLIMRTAEELALDLGSSWMIGDSESDASAGKAAGCRTAFVGSGEATGADVVAPSLACLSELIAVEAETAVVYSTAPANSATSE